MSNKTASPNHLPAASRWRLWIDGCGGFLLLIGDRVSIGRTPANPLSHGSSADRTLGTSGDRAKEDVSDSQVDIGVQADWPRIAGTIQRRSDDYFWSDAADPSCTGSSQGSLIDNGQTLPVAASAKVVFALTSPLSRTAVLRISSPHRFDRHVDAVVLVNKEVLIGPSRDCHIRHRDLAETIVLVCRENVWRGKVGVAGEYVALEPGRHLSLGLCEMTLEAA